MRASVFAAEGFFQHSVLQQTRHGVADDVFRQLFDKNQIGMPETSPLRPLSVSLALLHLPRDSPRSGEIRGPEAAVLHLHLNLDQIHRRVKIHGKLDEDFRHLAGLRLLRLVSRFQQELVHTVTADRGS